MKFHFHNATQWKMTTKWNTKSNENETSNDEDDEVKKPRVEKNNDNEANVKGAITELGVNVCCHGKTCQTDHFLQTTDNCVG